MVEFGLKRAGRLALGLLGACLLASVLAALSASHSADQTLLSIWVSHLGHLARSGFGVSPVTGVPLATGLAARLAVTLTLAALGTVVAVVLGVPLGVLLGAGPRFGVVVPVVEIVAAVPAFCGALLLLWLADHFWGGQGGRALGTLGWGGGPAALIMRLRSLALPVLTVGAAGAAATQAIVRTAVIAGLDAPHRRGLRLMGLTGLEADTAYLAPSIASDLLAGLGRITLAVLSATAVAEIVFGWPGIAALFVAAVAHRAWDAAALVLLGFAAITLAADFVGALCAYALTPSRVMP